MQIVDARNVNSAFETGTRLLWENGKRSQSRAGEVLVAPWPVVTVYAYPTERVLFSKTRDANPFFHLFESLWMLAGRRDGAFLDRFVSDFSGRFSESDGNLWGAYGHRWRHHWDADQLSVAVNRLRSSPEDRRTVIQMWDPEHDLWDPLECDENTGESFSEPRDIPCNTHIYLRIVEGQLDLTTCCRSNDVIWGAYGANAVHFSMLQEYLAGMIGVSVGTMYQFSNNFHMYLNTADKSKGSRLSREPYITGEVTSHSIGDNWSNWDYDLKRFIEEPYNTNFKNRWFLDVAVPMWRCHEFWKFHNKQAAMRVLNCIKATDWQMAARQWMERRL